MPLRLVAVTTDRRSQAPAGRPSGRVRPRRPEVFLGAAVVDRLRAQGLEPVLLPPRDTGDAAHFAALLARVEGLVIPGGAFDIHPRHYGQGVGARLDRVDEGRTALELGLARAAIAAGLPTLGLCGGMQVLAVAAGGTLVQDIAAQLAGAGEHEQPTDPATAWHPVALSGGPLRAALGPRTAVNSTHHQAVDDPGALVVCGRAPDGVVESVHHPDRDFCVGVQWHPELLGDGVFAAFAAAVARSAPT